ncbi:MAG: hypothetical protein MUE95_00945 [Cyclobacteriaceae bacterium]|nr:hypothetical protein [Cyclobacteriaceae bacterium]
MIRFIAFLLLISLFVLGAIYGSGIQMPSNGLKSLAFLFLATAGLFYYLRSTKEERPEIFVQLYLLTIAVKLLAYGAYLGLVIWEDRSGAMANVVFFMIVYVAFTVIEITFLWRQVSR